MKSNFKINLARSQAFQSHKGSVFDQIPFKIVSEILFRIFNAVYWQYYYHHKNLKEPMKHLKI